MYGEAAALLYPPPPSCMRSLYAHCHAIAGGHVLVGTRCSHDAGTMQWAHIYMHAYSICRDVIGHNACGVSGPHVCGLCRICEVSVPVARVCGVLHAYTYRQHACISVSAPSLARIIASYASTYIQARIMYIYIQPACLHLCVRALSRTDHRSRLLCVGCAAAVVRYSIMNPSCSFIGSLHLPF